MKTSSSVARSFSRILTGGIVACSLMVAGIAEAQWSENFDSYASGSQMHGQGGWAGWDNAAGAGALVSSAFAFSGANSVAITGASDLVHQYAGYASGVWTYSTMQYIPSSLTSGSTYFILLNGYTPNVGANDHWSIQTVFNLANGTLYDDNGYASLTNAIVRDAWVPLTYQIDLTANTVTASYNGVAFTTHAWQDGTGNNQIQAVDLYANNFGPVYYDNISLTQVPEPTTLGLLAAFGVTFAVWRRRSARS
jgi:hypothetical protein